MVDTGIQRNVAAHHLSDTRLGKRINQRIELVVHNHAHVVVGQRPEAVRARREKHVCSPARGKAVSVHARRGRCAAPVKGNGRILPRHSRRRQQEAVVEKFGVPYRARLCLGSRRCQANQHDCQQQHQSPHRVSLLTQVLFFVTSV